VLDIKGIVTIAVALASFLVAITNNRSLPSNIIGFVLPLAIGAVTYYLYNGGKESQISILWYP
jgi:hypothetical protein